MNNMEEVAKIIGVEICKKFETRGAYGTNSNCTCGYCNARNYDSH